MLPSKHEIPIKRNPASKFGLYGFNVPYTLFKSCSGLTFVVSCQEAREFIPKKDCFNTGNNSSSVHNDIKKIVHKIFFGFLLKKSANEKKQPIYISIFVKPFKLGIKYEEKQQLIIDKTKKARTKISKGENLILSK